MSHVFPYYDGVSFSDARGIGETSGCFRRDNSNVIAAGGFYYVYYNKGAEWNDFLTEWTGSVWAARSADGENWEEIGEMVACGPRGRWDAWATYCPNILVGLDHRYYLYFTGQPECQKAETPIHIGLAVADSPEGPFERIGSEPVFSPTGDEEGFDNWRVDDASVIPRDGRYWMYYKGRGYGRATSRTQIGLAFADRPQGPWQRFDHNPVIEVGHEIMVWPHREGVAVYAWSHGDTAEGDHAEVYFAPDGVRFSRELTVHTPPRNPGGFFADCYDDAGRAHGGEWGISFVSNRGREYLTRFAMDLRTT